MRRAHGPLREQADVMGQCSTHHCPRCGYRAQVGGGKQVGMTSVQWTVTCRDCRELHDAVVSEEPWEQTSSAKPLGLDPEWWPVDWTCPADNAHRAEPWETGDDCPKCGQSMLDDPLGDVVMWD